MSAEVLVGDGRVRVELDDGVAHVRLHRPEASNGMDVPFLRTSTTPCSSSTATPGAVRAAVGRGRNFCAGGDITTFAAQGEALPDYLREATTWLGNVASALLHVRAPVVTAVHGFAAGGGGFGLVCASDIVVAAESARFLLGATRVGMAPDAGGTVTLAQLVGAAQGAGDRPAQPDADGGRGAGASGSSPVVPDDELLEESWTIARTLAAGATLALAETKRMIWEGLGATRRRPPGRGVPRRVAPVRHGRRPRRPGRRDRQAPARVRRTLTHDASTGTT